MNKQNLKKNILIISISCVILLSLVLSLIIYSQKNYGKRKTFIFPSVDEGKYIVETRYLAQNPAKSDINYYVDELLLGSETERTKLLFTDGTTSLSCFERSGILYLNLAMEHAYKLRIIPLLNWSLIEYPKPDTHGK